MQNTETESLNFNISINGVCLFLHFLFQPSPLFLSVHYGTRYIVSFLLIIIFLWTLIHLSPGPCGFNSVEDTDRIAAFDHDNGINCKTWNIVEFAKMTMRFLKVSVFPHHYKHFFTVPKLNEEKKNTMLRVSKVF